MVCFFEAGIMILLVPILSNSFFKMSLYRYQLLFFPTGLEIKNTAF